MKYKLKEQPETLQQRLRKRAEIRLQIQSRKSVLLNEPDRLAELLVEAADKIDELDKECGELMDIIDRQENTMDSMRFR